MIDHPNRPTGLIRPRFNPGLTTILGLGSFTVIVLLMAATTWMDIEREKDIFQRELETQGRLLTQTLDDVLVDPLYFDDVSTAAKISELIAANQPDVNYIQIFDTDGTLIVDTRVAKYPTGKATQEHLLHASLDQRITISNEHEQELLIAGPVLAASELLATVNISLSTARLESDIQGIIVHHIWQALVVGVAGVLLSVLFARYITRPLRRLAEAARKVGEGEFVLSAGVQRSDEIGDLATAFEQMSRKLQSRTAELQLAQEKLEAKVTQRTTELEAANQQLEAFNEQLISEMNERLRLEEMERLRSQELENLVGISNILIQPKSFEERYEEVLEVVAQAGQADLVTMRMPDAEGLRLVCTAGPATLESPTIPVLVGEGTAASTAFQSQQVVTINDFSEHRHGGPNIFTGDMQSMVLLPITAGDEAVGLITVLSKKTSNFSPEIVKQLTVVTQGLGVLLENAKLSEDLRVGANEMALVDEIARIITSTLDIDEVYETFAAESEKLVNSDRMTIAFVNHRSRTFRKKYGSGPVVSGQLVGDDEYPIANQMQKVVDGGRTLVRDDIATDIRFQFDLDHVAAGVRSVISLPLFSKGQVIGVLVLRSQQIAAYGVREQAILERLAKQIAPAVENALLYEQILRNQSELRMLSQDAVAEKDRATAAETRLSAILNTAVDAIVAVDEGQRVTLFSQGAERMFGYPAEEVLGQFLSMLLPEHALALTTQSECLPHTGRRGEVTGLRKDGSEFPAEAKISKLTEDGQTVFIAMLQDVTERKQLEERLNQAQKMESIGQLAGGVAHDFNNLLSVISGYTDMLLSKDPIKPVNRDHLLEVSKAAERASQLTNQLLGFSRRQVVKPMALDLDAALISAYPMLRRVIGENVELVILPGEGLPLVFIDPGQLDQIIMNLVVNARDAMAEGGTVTVSTRLAIADSLEYPPHSQAAIVDCVVLHVSDTGSGMTDEVKAHLFEPFFTTKETGKGTGLGLATCYGIVQQNGGHIEVDSKLGQGSTFEVYLPISEGGEGPEVNNHVSTMVPRTVSGTETILVVEDEPQVRELVSQILADQGYSILQAANGEEALRVCDGYQGQEIQLLITDMVMPQMSGGELVREINSRRPGIKLLVVSGYAEDAMERSVVARDDVHFMHKPFRPGELVSTVRGILDQPTKPLN